MFYSHKILHQNKRNTRRRNNKQNLSLCLLVSPVKWSAASLSLCVFNTWSAWHFDEQACLYEILKRSFCSCQDKDMLHTFGKRCVGCFCIEASCITLVSPGKWEGQLHCCFSQFPSKSFVVSFQFLTVKMSSTEIDILTLFVYKTCPSLAKAEEIKYLNSSRHSCLLCCKPTSLKSFR